mmetsp:Transcript_97662/g.304263  ORF Transcript_97662/g.304263 Transcript_97662/m.304263 type:complete len:301 (+) Transcript_97662:322-1224(+)
MCRHAWSNARECSPQPRRCPRPQRPAPSGSESRSPGQSARLAATASSRGRPRARSAVCRRAPLLHPRTWLCRLQAPALEIPSPWRGPGQCGSRQSIPSLRARPAREAPRWTGRHPMPQRAGPFETVAERRPPAPRGGETRPRGGPGRRRRGGPSERRRRRWSTAECALPPAATAACPAPRSPPPSRRARRRQRRRKGSGGPRPLRSRMCEGPQTTKASAAPRRTAARTRARHGPSGPWPRTRSHWPRNTASCRLVTRHMLACLARSRRCTPTGATARGGRGPWDAIPFYPGEPGTQTQRA